MIIPSNKLEYLKDLCEQAKTQRSIAFEGMQKAKKQYDGDDTIDGSSEKASYVRNITYELIEAQINSEIPAPKVNPRSQSEKGTRNAAAAERLLKTVRNLLPFEQYNDEDERNTYIYGASIWLIEWDESETTHHTAGEVKVSLIHPEDFFPQPNIPNIQDMEYIFLRYVTTKDELTRRYGVKDTSEVELDGDHSEGVNTDETCTVYVCYYRDDSDHICRYAWSGDLELEDITDYYARKVKVCRKCHRKEAICTCDHPDLEDMPEDEEVLFEDIVLPDGRVIPKESPVILDGGVPKTKMGKAPVIQADGSILLDSNGEPVLQDAPEAVMQPTRIPYYRPKMMPVVIRKNVSCEGDVFGKSDCLEIRQQQQAINKVESRIMQKLMRSNVTAVVPDDAQITINNQVFGQVVKLRPGEHRSDYGTIDNTPDISRDIAEAERIYDHAKRILGISDSYLGQYDASAKSGKAKQVQVAQSAGRMESKRRMKQSAYADIDRIVFEYYLAYADEPRPIAYRDRWGIVRNEEFNRYAFVDYDKDTGEWYYDDRYLFSVDNSSFSVEDRDSEMQSTINLWQAGAFGNPQDPTTMILFWERMERLHYAGASEAKDYFIARLDQLQGAQYAEEENIQGIT